MSTQQQEINEAQEMLGVGMLHQKLAALSDSHAIENMYKAGLELERELTAVKAERDLHKARYEYLKSLCCIGLRSEKYDWCELRGRTTVVLEKYCATVDDAVDFVLGGNGNEQTTIKAST